jgi:hypothetical protein
MIVIFFLNEYSCIILYNLCVNMLSNVLIYNFNWFLFKLILYVSLTYNKKYNKEVFKIKL